MGLVVVTAAMLGLSAWALVIAYGASATLTDNREIIPDKFCTGTRCNKYIVMELQKATEIGDDMCVGGCNSLT